jgi:hypothetical protein
MKIKLFFVVALILLFNQSNKAQNTLAGAKVFDSNNGFKAQETIIVYDQAELLAMGFSSGYVIDTLCFNFTSRHNISPYLNFDVSHYYTNPFFAFSQGVPYLPPMVSPGGNAYSGILDVSTVIPPTGGIYQLPLTAPIVWNGSGNSLVIQICWSLNNGMPSDSLFALQVPNGARKTARWRVINPTAGSCLSSLNSSAIRNSSEWRPDLFSCNTPTSINNANALLNSNSITHISVTENGLVKIDYTSNGKVNNTLFIYDLTGRIVFEKTETNDKSGDNSIELKLPAAKGIYCVSLKNEKHITAKLFAN